MKQSPKSKASTIGRKALVVAYRKFIGLFGSFVDHMYLDPSVPISKLVGHSSYLEYLTDTGNHEGIKILEIGSREVTGRSDARTRFANAEYVGFDYYPGPNVDVVGDAHKLSQYFGDQQFDVIYSSAVFEHFAMPWVVATEIAKLLKIGGIIFVETHFSFSSHERPWHFFQFTDMALRVLFSPALGIECIEAGASSVPNGRNVNERWGKCFLRKTLGREDRVPGEDHLNFHSPEEWAALFEEAGFKVVGHDMAIGCLVNDIFYGILRLPILVVVGPAIAWMADKLGRRFDPLAFERSFYPSWLMERVNIVDQWLKPVLKGQFGWNLFVLQKRTLVTDPIRPLGVGGVVVAEV